jgi:hypothetical protein
MKEFIIRNELGNIDIQLSLNAFQEELNKIKKNEIPASTITEYIHVVLDSFPGQKIPKNSLIAKICANLDFDPKIHNQVVEKINLVINNELQNKSIYSKPGKNGGFYK